MDVSDISTSPRKKPKLHHQPSVNHIMGQSIESITDAADVADAVDVADSLSDHIEDDQLSKEVSCGITELVSPQVAGFVGTLKKRYTDFLVNEILPSGVVVHLDNLRAPRKGKQIAQHVEAKATSSAATGDDAEQHRNDPKIHEIQTNKPPVPSSSPSPEVDSSLLAVKPPPASLPPHLRPYLQGPIENHSPVETSPVVREKYKTVLRETVDGLFVVDPNDAASLPSKSSAPVSHSDRHQDIRVLEQPSTTTDMVAASSDGNGNDALDAPRQEPVSTSVPEWQAFANVTRQSQKLAVEDRELLLSFFDAETVDSIATLHQRIVRSPRKKSKDYGIVKSAPVMDRDVRTKIHHAIREVFNSCLETSTDENNAILISAMPQKSDWTARTPVNRSNREKSSHQKGKLGWQELGGEHLHFTLYKENKDTMEVILYLAKLLKMKPQAFQFAGTKDRRGVTAQRVSVYRVFADRMMSVGHTLRNAKVGNFEYQPSSLQLGQLTGNEFVITLRDCQFGEDDVIGQDKITRASHIVGCAIENLKRNGFLNYYGLQRFGTFSVPTDTIGMKMLQGDFEAAVKAILDFSQISLIAAQNDLSHETKISADDKARASALNQFRETGKTQPALRNLPRKFNSEACIIKYLGEDKRARDFYGALQSIPRNLRLMYVHAYQSLVWNVVASKRWILFGPCVVEGDLVLIEEHKDKMGEVVKPDGVDADGEVVVQPGEDDRALNPDDIFIRARALTKDEACSDTYSIFDVVLPTPGYDILYPANEMLDVYKEFMGSERGGGLDPLDMHRKWKDVNLSGSYRKFLARPGENISFEIKTYVDENEQFVQTDLDRLVEIRQQQHSLHGDCPKSSEGLKGSEVPEEQQQTMGLNGSKDDDAKADDWDAIQDHLNARKQELGGSSVKAADEEDIAGEETIAVKQKNSSEEGTAAKEKIAVILKLQLGTSQYATMALRELMKVGGVKTYKPDFGGGR